MLSQQTRELISAWKKSHIDTATKIELHAVTLTWYVSKYKVHKLHQMFILN